MRDGASRQCAIVAAACAVALHGDSVAGRLRAGAGSATGRGVRPFDIVIRNGHIIDGTGSPWYAGDIGIRDGRIAAIGRSRRARRKQTIDAAGRVVAPGSSTCWDNRS